MWSRSGLLGQVLVQMSRAEIVAQAVTVLQSNPEKRERDSDLLLLKASLSVGSLAVEQNHG